MSSKNYTFVPLEDGGDSFTGVREKCDNYASVVTLAKTDQPCTLIHQFSSDGTNWDSESSFSLLADTAKTCESECRGRFFRLYIAAPNSGSNQTYMRATTSFKNIPQDSATISSVTVASLPAVEIASGQEVSIANDLNVTNSLTVGTLPDITIAA